MTDPLTRLRKATSRLEEARRILTDLLDESPCWFDHHGYCQGHGWFEVEPKCPHARAKEFLVAQEKSP